MLHSTLAEKQEYYKKINVPELIEALPAHLLAGQIEIGRIKHETSVRTATFPNEVYAPANDLIYLSQDNDIRQKFLISHIVRLARLNQPSIVFDTSYDHPLTPHLQRLLTEEKCVVVDFTEPLALQLTYQELTVDVQAPKEVVANILNLKSSLTAGTLASLKGHAFTERMEQLVLSASTLVYLNNGTTILDVVKCLTDHVTRQDYVDNALQIATRNTALKTMVETAITTLNRINVTTKSQAVVGTAAHKIDFLTSRMAEYSKDPLLSQLGQKNGRKLSLNKCISKGQTVIFKLNDPKVLENSFIMTYLISKIAIFRTLRSYETYLAPFANVFVDMYRTTPINRAMLSDLAQNNRAIARISLTYLASTLAEVKPFYEPFIFMGISKIFTGTAKIADVVNSSEEIAPYTPTDFMKLRPIDALAFIRSAHDEITPFTCKLKQAQI